MPVRFLGGFVVCLGLFGGCSKLEQPREGEEAGPLPLTEYHDTTILDMHEGSRLSWRLKTLHLVRWPGSELVHASPVDLSVNDSLGVQVMRVTADSGAVDEPVNFLLARGNVHGVSSKGMELFTDSLRWSKSLNQVSTEASVRVISENGDVLTGRGFVSDANLEHWQILSDVKGVFQDAGERTGELDAPAASPDVQPETKPGAEKPATPAQPSMPSKSAEPAPVQGGDL